MPIWDNAEWLRHFQMSRVSFDGATECGLLQGYSTAVWCRLIHHGDDHCEGEHSHQVRASVENNLSARSLQGRPPCHVMIKYTVMTPPPCAHPGLMSSFLISMGDGWLPATGLPHHICAVDGTYTMIYSLGAHGAEFINRKSTYSVLMQGTTNHMGCFIDVEVEHSK